MIPVKVLCGCGQKYAFEVDPIDGHMPTAVKCPACGVDGTRLANEFIAQALGMQPAEPAVAVMAAAPAAPAIRVGTTAAPAVRAPAIRIAPLVEAAPPAPAPTPLPQRGPPALPQRSRGKDGWAREETDVNKLGTFVIMAPVLFAALFASGAFGVRLSGTLLVTVVAIGGVLGGMLNIAGRGPVLAGAFIGLVIALGGYGAVYWWIEGRANLRKFEMMIAMFAFVVGVIPGFLLQAGLQAILRRRARGCESG